MSISYRDESPIFIFSVRGIFDVQTYHGLIRLIPHIPAGTNCILLNCQGVSGVNDGVLQKLTELKVDLCHQGITLALCSLTEEIQKTKEAKIDRLIIFDDEPEALAQLAAYKNGQT